MKLAAVIFDADETIFNNQGIHLLITKKILAKLNMPLELAWDVHSKWDEYYLSEQQRVIQENGFCIDRENANRSLVLALKHIGKEISLEDSDKLWIYMDKEYTKRSKPYPDALKLIKFLAKKKIKMAIVSNGDYEIIMKRLRKSKIVHYFDFVLVPCKNFPCSKPDLKIFQETITRLNTPIENIIFIGDNPYSDIMGANRAGIYTILIDRYNKITQLEGLQKPSLKISSFEELIKTIDQL